MKALRICASVLTLSAIGLLTACGGGGGSGYAAPPTVNPGGPAPSASASPSPSPSTSPTTSPAPGAPSTITASGTEIDTHEGLVNGAANTWAPTNGDSSTGGTGSNSPDGINCGLTSESQVTSTSFHAHVFLGFIVNGTYVQIPAGLGMAPPGTMTNGVILGPAAGGCMYYIHTHDAAGIIHLENPTMSQTTGDVATPYTLQNIFDIWGMGPGMAGFPSGNVIIYAGMPSGLDSNNNEEVTSYSLQSSTALTLNRHMAIWVLVNTDPTTPGFSLPPVGFSYAD